MQCNRGLTVTTITPAFCGGFVLCVPIALDYHRGYKTTILRLTIRLLCLRYEYQYLLNWLGKCRVLQHGENWNTANLPPLLPNYVLQQAQLRSRCNAMESRCNVTTITPAFCGGFVLCVPIALDYHRGYKTKKLAHLLLLHFQSLVTITTGVCLTVVIFNLI